MAESQKGVKWGPLLAEGATIVIGILLAFAIDAWWDVRQGNSDAREALAAVDAEFAEVALELENTLRGQEIIAASADTILGVLRSGQNQVSSVHLRWAVDAPTTDLTQAALAALLARGGLESIPSGELRTLLAAWPPLLEDVLEEESDARRFAQEELLPYLSEVVDIGAVLGEARLAGQVGVRVTVPADVQMLNMIEIRRYHAGRVIADRNQSRIDEMVGRIREEIARYLN